MKLPLSVASPDSAPELAKPSLPTTWLILHTLFCATSMTVGFRFSRLVVFLLFLPTPPLNPAAHLVSLVTPPLTLVHHGPVFVGHHTIGVRKWPHPDPSELLKAHHILAAVQTAQRSSSPRGNGPPRPVIAITPTVIAKINGEASTPTLSAPPRSGRPHLGAVDLNLEFRATSPRVDTNYYRKCG
ncbi:probable glucuronosyltransferase Os04g0650300 [Lolium perenne]|uniref:probable glucuronosyltransferase Os04g0650300 n=1 Tax=Lolium perenne TaxID=4522 RepID=UPI003A99B3D9